MSNVHSWGFTQNNKLHIIYSPQAKNWRFYSYSIIYFSHHLGCFHTEEDAHLFFCLFVFVLGFFLRAPCVTFSFSFWWSKQTVEYCVIFRGDIWHPCSRRKKQQVTRTEAKNNSSVLDLAVVCNIHFTLRPCPHQVFYSHIAGASLKMFPW